MHSMDTRYPVSSLTLSLLLFFFFFLLFFAFFFVFPRLSFFVLPFFVLLAVCPC